jgi:glycosyltransferase involved in cell wall biosynthesis
VRVLFVHQNFPAQFLHLLRHLRRSPDNELVFITEPNSNSLPGVRTIVYKMPREASEETHPDAREFEQATLRGEIVAGMAANLKRLGFQPDIIIGHHGWGELLNIRDPFPDTPLLGYFEFYYRLQGSDVSFDPEFPTHPSLLPRIRAKNTVNLLALTNGGHGHTPTQWQLSTYPDWARPQISLVPDGVDLEVCRPERAARRASVQIGDIAVAAGERLVTYVARNLEPYRGFHTMMRALPALLARRDVRVIMVGGDDVSYGAKLAEGTWREHMLREVAGRIDLSRVHFPGQISYADYLKVLKRSDAHVYLSYPFVASWSLREALACGCVVVASDTAPVQEFVTDGQNGLLTPCLDPRALAERVLEVLDNAALARRLSAAARSYAEAHLPMADHLDAYDALIARLTGGGMPSVARLPPRRAAVSTPSRKPRSAA